MREHKGLPTELERSLIERLVKANYGEDANALVEYVFEVMDYRSMKFQDIINELQDIEVCHICGEASPSEYMVDTEGAVDGGYGHVCDWCYGNGR